MCVAVAEMCVVRSLIKTPNKKAMSSNASTVAWPAYRADGKTIKRGVATTE